MNKNEKIRQLYLAALQEQAFHHAKTIEQLIERLENGELPSDVARVAIDGRKWIASHFQPMMFSERVQQHLTVMLNGKIVDFSQDDDIFKNPTHPYTRKLLASIPVASWER
tara:strand:+ start:57 stop:389 length:333 start_codon:yes stop_codon:yes gene_type:complete